MSFRNSDSSEYPESKLDSRLLAERVVYFFSLTESSGKFHLPVGMPSAKIISEFHSLKKLLHFLIYYSIFAQIFIACFRSGNFKNSYQEYSCQIIMVKEKFGAAALDLY
jgi:hypothetical protein